MLSHNLLSLTSVSSSSIMTRSKKSAGSSQKKKHNKPMPSSSQDVVSDVDVDSESEDTTLSELHNSCTTAGSATFQLGNGNVICDVSHNVGKSGSDILDDISRLAKDIVEVFERGNKSVLKDDKNDIKAYAKSIIEKVQILKPNFINELSSKVGLNTSPITSDTSISNALNEILRNQKVMREEINLLKNKPKSLSKSYVDVASSQTSFAYGKSFDKPNTPKKTTYSSIVKASDTSQSTSQVIDLFKSNVNPRKLKCGINKITRLSNKTIRLDFDTEKERDAVIEATNKTSVLKSEVSRKRRPLVIFKGLQKDVSDEEFIDALIEQNSKIEDVISQDSVEHHIKFRFSLKNRNIHLKNNVVETSPQVFKLLIEAQRANVGHQKVYVQEYSSFVQCLKCYGFGHTTRHCSATSDVCGHCAGGHRTSECDAKDSQPKCINCHKSNVKRNTSESTNHKASSAYCPNIIRIRQRVIESTDYGC